MSEEDKRKRARKPGPSPQKKKLKVQMLPKGVERLPNEGGGNCLYLAVAQSLEQVTGTLHNHRSVRAAAFTHLQKHLQKYSLFWDGRMPDDQKAADTSTVGFKAYLDKAAEPNQWGGNLELSALAATLDRPITVIHQYGQVYTFNQQSAKRDLFIYYGSNHYESLSVPSELVLSIRAKALAGKPAGGRCGGKSTAKSSASNSAVSILGGLTASSVKSVCSRAKSISKKAASLSSLGGKTVVTEVSGTVNSGTGAARSWVQSIGGLTRRSFAPKGWDLLSASWLS